jgi:hypothetical protein
VSTADRIYPVKSDPHRKPDECGLKTLGLSHSMY